jgi:trans-aconitate methyltransferase
MTPGRLEIWTCDLMNSKQEWDSNSYQKHTGFVSVLGEGVFDWLKPVAGEHILDLGCGDGVLTEKISQSGASAIGVDASAQFVASAKERGIDARQMDGHKLEFENEFDAVFTNAALHWMLEPEMVANGVERALKPGGRFVGEFGGFGNVAAISTAMRSVAHEMNGDPALASPWYFPTNKEYKFVLSTAGFDTIEVQNFYRPTPLPTGMKQWLYVMRKPFFDQFDEQSDVAMQNVLNALEPSLCDQSGNWIADYVRLRFRAELNR